MCSPTNPIPCTLRPAGLPAKFLMCSPTNPIPCTLRPAGLPAKLKVPHVQSHKSYTLYPTACRTASKFRLTCSPTKSYTLHPMECRPIYTDDILLLTCSPDRQPDSITDVTCALTAHPKRDVLPPRASAAASASAADSYHTTQRGHPSRWGCTHLQRNFDREPASRGATWQLVVVL
jgi:hypothetical protein